MKYFLVVAIFLLLVTGCKADATDDVIKPTVVTISNEPTQQIEAIPTAETIDERNVTSNIEIDSDEAPEVQAKEEDTVAPSGSVDLRELPPSKDNDSGNGELVVQPAPMIPDLQSKMEELSILDLAKRLELDPDEIETISTEFVEWSDGSLGCAERGAMYIQVLTPGYIVQLKAEGEDYEYHTDSNEQVILCKNGRPLSSN